MRITLNAGKNDKDHTKNKMKTKKRKGKGEREKAKREGDVLFCKKRKPKGRHRVQKEYNIGG